MRHKPIKAAARVKHLAWEPPPACPARVTSNNALLCLAWETLIWVNLSRYS